MACPVCGRGPGEPMRDQDGKVVHDGTCPVKVGAAPCGRAFVALNRVETPTFGACNHGCPVPGHSTVWAEGRVRA